MRAESAAARCGLGGAREAGDGGSGPGGRRGPRQWRDGHQRDCARFRRAFPGGPAGGDAQQGCRGPGGGHRGASRVAGGRAWPGGDFARVGAGGGFGYARAGQRRRWYLVAGRGFDVRGALEARLGLPVIYSNDANAASLYAHDACFGPGAGQHSSVSLIVGTGLGGGVIESGRGVRGAAGMAGELGHIQIPMNGLLAQGQPTPQCNCGLSADGESVASLTGIEKNLLPYWLTRFPGHELHAAGSARQAAKLVRGYASAGDPMAMEIFRQQAIAVGRLFTIAANFTDPDACFLGGGVVEAKPSFRDWFLATVREHTDLRAEQLPLVTFALVPDLDMAGARGAAIAAARTLGWAPPVLHRR